MNQFCEAFQIGFVHFTYWRNDYILNETVWLDEENNTVVHVDEGCRAVILYCRWVDGRCMNEADASEFSGFKSWNLVIKLRFKWKDAELSVAYCTVAEFGI